MVMSSPLPISLLFPLPLSFSFSLLLFLSLSLLLLLPLILAIHLALTLPYAFLGLADSRISDLLDGLEPLDLVGHACDNELLAEQTPLATGALAHGLGEVLAVSLSVRLFDGREVLSVPVEAHKAADEQLAAQTVLSGRCECVVQE